MHRGSEGGGGRKSAGGRGSGLLRSRDTMSGRKHSRFATQLLRTGAYVATAFWLAFAYGGWEIAVSAPGSAGHSPVLGWAILAGCIVVATTTVNHWVKYLRFVLGGLTLGALSAVVGGHIVGSNVQIPRLVAAELAALSAACGLISHTLATRRLAIFDRAALVGFVAAAAIGMFTSPKAAVVGLAVGFAFLLAAWARARGSRPPRRGDSNRPHVATNIPAVGPGGR